MKRPSFQFYPGDWMRNANLRRCSPAARGVWIDVICLLHDSSEYGLLRWPLKDISHAIGAPLGHITELVTKGVLKGADSGAIPDFIYIPRSGRQDGAPVPLIQGQSGPLWYSSRMVKDEYVLQNRGKNTRFGGGKNEEHPSPSRSPTARVGEPEGDGSSSSSSSATAVVREIYTPVREDADMIERIRLAYHGRRDAENEVRQIIADSIDRGEDPVLMLSHVQRCATNIEASCGWANTWAPWAKRFFAEQQWKTPEAFLRRGETSSPKPTDRHAAYNPESAKKGLTNEQINTF